MQRLYYTQKWLVFSHWNYSALYQEDVIGALYFPIVIVITHAMPLLPRKSISTPVPTTYSLLQLKFIWAAKNFIYIYFYYIYIYLYIYVYIYIYIYIDFKNSTAETTHLGSIICLFGWVPYCSAFNCCCDSFINPKYNSKKYYFTFILLSCTYGREFLKRYAVIFSSRITWLGITWRRRN